MMGKGETPSPLYGLFGLWFVWSPTFGTTEATVFSSLQAYPDALFISRIVILIAFIVSCVLLIFLGRYLSPLLSRTSFIWGCGCVLCMGMLLGSLPALGAPIWLIFVGSALRGLVSGFFVQAWLDELASLNGRGVGVALFEALAVYGVAGVSIPLLAGVSTAAAVFVMALLPLASCWACVLLSKNVRQREKVVPHSQHLPLGSKVLFAMSNLFYGFLFGIMLSYFSTLGNMGLYGAFALIALGIFLCFLFIRHEVDLSISLRLYVAIAAFAFLVSVLLAHVGVNIIPFVETGIWAVQIFFSIVIFIDADFSLPGMSGRVIGFSLGVASVGILMATILFPPNQVSWSGGTDLLVASFAAMLVLCAVFLPNGHTWVRKWGFSSFVMPESHETYVARRCGELTAERGLTTREFEILQLLARGYHKDDISEALVISPLTTKTHIRNVYAKLGVHTQDELVALVEEKE